MTDLYNNALLNFNRFYSRRRAAYALRPRNNEYEVSASYDVPIYSLCLSAIGETFRQQ